MRRPSSWGESCWAAFTWQEGGESLSGRRGLVPGFSLLSLVYHSCPGFGGSGIPLDLLGKKNLLQKQLFYTLRVVWEGKSKEIRALLDTGHYLRDPLTSEAVVVVEARALEDLLPGELMALCRGPTEGNPDFSSFPWASRVRLIPYRFLGSPGDVMLAFQPQEVQLITPPGDQNLP
ncbi:MAG TPA: hypothetical protein ENM97_02490 [Moorella mulderi]|nr:hypothetical protein [Moorella mulderi]